MITRLTLDFQNQKMEVKEIRKNSRIICWFSCGGPSAVAAKETLRLYGSTHNVIVVNCDTRPSEHPDNYRFCDEVEKWLGVKILHIKNENYLNVDQLFVRRQYMSGVRGAVCTTQLKKIPRLQFADPYDTHVFGFTYGEEKRVRDFTAGNPDMLLKFTLVEQKITRSMALFRLAQAGIELPVMYRIFDKEDRLRYGQDGFDNNNCPGCVKASSPWYWSMIRKYFPDVFQRRCQQSRALGCRLVEISHHKRIFLDELPDRIFKKRKKKENLSCGPECGGPVLRLKQLELV